MNANKGGRANDPAFTSPISSALVRGDAFNNLKQRSWNAPKASYYLQGRGYTEDDVERAVSDAAGTNMHDWFERHVGGTEDMDYDEALAWAGLKLVRSDHDPWRIEEIRDATPQQPAGPKRLVERPCSVSLSRG